MNLPDSQLSATDRTRLEELLLEFDQNWTEHHLGIMAGQLDAELPEFKAVALVELVKIDLDYRYREVRPTQIEWYLKRFKELRESPDTVSELLQAELEVWLLAGEAPSVEDLTQRFPSLRDRLAAIIEKAEQGKVRSQARRAKREAEASETDKPSLGSTASIALAAQETLPPTTRNQITPGANDDSSLGQFGRYRLLRELGRGAMGTVYLGEDTELRRQVALKRPRIGENEATALLQRFYREAYAAATLNHPNICPVYDIGEHEGVPYITMAYVEGKTLSRVIRDSRALNPRAVALLVRKIALALAEAHDKGVIHRDLKPGNIMLNHRSEPIVMDFGLARQVEHADDRLSVDGMLIGTPGYMSPEQVDGDLEKVGRASDIYSLGVVLFELLTGRLPFQGSVAAVIGKILRDEAPAPSSLRAGLPDEMDAICLKMMAKSPSDRYTSMAEVAEVLSSLSKKLGGETTSAAAPPPVESTTTAQLAAQRQQISQMIHNGQWREASLQLQRMSELEGSLAAPYVQWAREQTEALHLRWQEEQVAAAQSLAMAKDEFARHDYAGAAQRLVKIDKQLLTVESQQLLDESFKLAEEVDLLIHLIEQGLNRGSQAGMFRNMQRLLQLKPRDPLVRDLYRKFRWQQRLGWIGATLADAFAMSGISRMRTTIEDPMYRKWFAAAAVVFLISFGLMSWHVAAYLRDSQVGQAEPTNATSSDVQADGGQSPLDADEEPPLLPMGTGRTPLPDGPPGLVATLTRHTDKIQGLVVSPDGRYLISTDSSGAELIWDLESRDVVGAFEMTSIMYSLLIVTKGNEVISGGVHGRLERHSLRTQKKSMSYRGYPDQGAEGSLSIGSLHAMPESNGFVTCNFSGDVAVWNVDSELPVAEFSVGPEYRFVHPVREGFLLSGWDNHVRLASGEGSFVRDFAETPSGPLTVFQDGTVFIRRELKSKMILEVLIGTGETLHSYQCSEWPVWSEFTPDGRYLICENANNEMQVWNRESGLLIYSETLPLMAERRAFSPDGRFVFLAQESGAAKQPDTHEIYIWRLPMEVWPKSESEATPNLSDDKPNADMSQAITPSPPSIGLQFDGDDHIEIPRFRYDGTKPLTVEAVISCDPAAMPRTKLGNVLANNQSGGFFFGVREGCVRFTVVDQETGSYGGTGSPVLDLPIRLLHVAGVVDGQAFRLYVDGKKVDEEKLPGGHRPSGRPVYIGTDPEIDGSPSVKGHYVGRLFAVRISSRALYSDDFSIPTSFEADDSTECLYEMNAGVGDTILDTSQHRRHAKIVGATWITEAEGNPATVPLPATPAEQVTAATATKAVVAPPPVAAPKKHILIKAGNEGGHSWHYSLAPPPTRWQVPEGEDTWPVRLSAFGTPGAHGTTVRTEWIHPNIYLRTKVYVPRFDGRKMVLRCAHDDWAEVYVNGTLVKRFDGYSGYVEYTLVGNQIYLFQQNAFNDVAVRCHQNNASFRKMDKNNPQVIDVGLRLE